MAGRLLAVTHDADGLSALAAQLSAQGWSLIHCTSVLEARGALNEQQADLCVLDSGLARDGAAVVLRAWRDQGHATPVVVRVTGDGQDRYPGADGFLDPAQPAGHAAAVAAVVASLQGPRQLILGSGRVDLATRRLEGPGASLTLSEQEARLLGHLASRAHRAVGRDELLRVVWGFSQSVPTRAVDNAIRRLRTKVEPDPAKPVHLLTVRGLGYRLVAEAVRSPGPVVSPVPRAATNLPKRERDAFVGRIEDLDALATLFAEGATAVTLLGPGGMGKTRLARRFGARWHARHGSAWFCDLTAAQGLAELVQAVGSSLGVQVSGADRAAVEQLGHALAARGEVLLILDNCEQLVEAAASAVEVFVQLAPDARVLATSRERLRVRGERCLELGGLSGPEAYELFVTRARAVDRNFEPDPEEIERIEEVVERLDGLPLALELAAARVGVLSPAQLNDALDKSVHRVLRGSERGREPRQATLWGAIDWSWRLLDPMEQAVLAQSSIFRGGFTLTAAEDVLDLGDWSDAPWTLDVIQSLRDKSLLRSSPRADRHAEARFTLFETVREYAEGKLDEMGRVPELRGQHALWCLELGEGLAAGVATRGGRRKLRKLQLEVDNLRAVHERHRVHDPDITARAALVLDVVLQTTGPLDLRVEVLDQALSGADLSPERRVQLLLARGRALRISGDVGRAVDDLQAARDEAGMLGARRDEAAALAALGACRVETGKLEAGRAKLQHALDVAQSVADLGTEVQVLRYLGIADRQAGEIDASLDHLGRALTLVRRLGDPRGEASVLRQLGEALSVAGQSGEAERRLRESLELARDLGDWAGEGEVLETLGTLYQRMSDTDAAEGYFTLARDVHRAVGNRPGEASVLLGLGACAIARQRFDAAKELYARAADLAEALEDPSKVAAARMGLGNLYAAEDNVAEAERQYRGALASFRATGSRWREGVALSNLGGLLMARDDRLEEAQAVLTEAMAIHEEVGAPRYEGLARFNMGVVHQILGRPESAQESYGVAIARGEEVGDKGLVAYARALMGSVQATEDHLGDAEREHAAARLAMHEAGGGRGLAVLDLCEGFLELARAREARHGGDPRRAADFLEAARGRVEGARELARRRGDVGLALRLLIRDLERTAA